MIECSLYGIASKIFDWTGKSYHRKESVYSKGRNTICIRTSTPIDRAALSSHDRQNSHPAEVELIIREEPDRSKDKACMVRKQSRSRLISGGDPHMLMGALGYQLVGRTDCEVHEYRRRGYSVELSRMLSKEKNGLSTHFLVKVYTESPEAATGERIIDTAYKELEEFVKLTKPPINWFIQKVPGTA